MGEGHGIGGGEADVPITVKAHPLHQVGDGIGAPDGIGNAQGGRLVQGIGQNQCRILVTGSGGILVGVGGGIILRPVKFAHIQRVALNVGKGHTEDVVRCGGLEKSHALNAVAAGSVFNVAFAEDHQPLDICHIDIIAV